MSDERTTYTIASSTIHYIDGRPYAIARDHRERRVYLWPILWLRDGEFVRGFPPTEMSEIEFHMRVGKRRVWDADPVALQISRQANTHMRKHGG